MTNVFGVLMKGKSSPDGNCFQAKQVNNKLLERQAALAKELSALEAQTKPTTWQTVIKYVTFLTACALSILFFAVLTGEGIDPQKTAIKYLWAVIAAAVLFAVSAILQIRSRRLIKSVQESEAFARLEREGQRLMEDCKRYLGVPNEVTAIDVFFYPYKLKDGQKVNYSPEIDFVNQECMAYVDGERLQISEGLSVYSFELERLGKIERVQKRVRFNAWNKKQPPFFGEYKKSKIRITKLGVYSIGGYITLEIKGVNGCEEGFFIALPDYEKDALNALLKR